MGNEQIQNGSPDKPSNQSAMDCAFVKPEPFLVQFLYTDFQVPKPIGQSGILATMTNKDYGKQYEKYLCMQKEKEGFKDNVFQAHNKSLGGRLKTIGITWKRPDEFMDKNRKWCSFQVNLTLFRGSSLQNYYLASALACFARKQSTFAQVIRRISVDRTQESITGCYGLWLCIDGGWKFIFIDDLMPVDHSQYMFSKYGNELWIMVLEKVYAKYFKSYANTQKQLLGHFLTALTGAPSYYLCQASEQADPDQVWQQLQEGMRQGYIMAVSTECLDGNQYIERPSAYSYPVIDCQQVETLTTLKNKIERVLKLDNPWGQFEWKGRWSEYSDVWSEELRHRLDYEKADETVIWITVEDMLMNIGQLCICKYKPKHITTSLNISFDRSKTSEAKGILIKAERQTAGHLSVVQSHHKNYQRTYKYSTCHLILLQIDQHSKQPSRILKQILDCKHYNSLEFNVEPGIYYAVLYMDWATTLTRDVVINVYGSSPVGVYLDTHQISEQSMFYGLVELYSRSKSGEEVHVYGEDSNIARECGQIGGYAYYYYRNKSAHDIQLWQQFNLADSQNLQICEAVHSDKIQVQVPPGDQKVLKLKIKDNQFHLAPNFKHKMVHKYSPHKLHEMLIQKATKVKKRQIQNNQIEVYVRTLEYSGGVAVLYQNKMSKHSFIEQVTFSLINLRLEDESLDSSNKLIIQLNPHDEKMLSFLVQDFSLPCAFKTKSSYYLDSPQFQF